MQQVPSSRRGPNQTANLEQPETRVEIRPYREDDEAAVAALWREIFPDAPAHNRPEADIWRKLAVQRELFLVAMVDAELVGTAMAGYDGHRGWLYYLAVHPAHRRQGIGEALMGRVQDDLAAIGCPKLNLQVRAENIGAVAFYRRLGFDIEERVSMGKRLAIPHTEEATPQE
jgi:ribosomal protein S18 acetylase RimI-like enzyme